MEFDKSKVYTVFNADEVKIGSKGYFADSKNSLIVRVETENDGYFSTLKEANSNRNFAFYAESNSSSYNYFYLVEEPKEPKKRPCTKEELIEMLKTQGLPMLKNILTDKSYTVLKISDPCCIVYDGGEYTYNLLCEHFTLLDGTELWVEE